MFRVTTVTHAGHRDDVPDVARRADHRARPAATASRSSSSPASPPACRTRSPARWSWCAPARCIRSRSILIAVAVVAVTAFVVLRRARPAQDPGQLRQAPGRQPRLSAGRARTCRFKLNMSGVIPPIFASSLILFPATVLGWFGIDEGLVWLSQHLGDADPGAADLRAALRRADHLLLLLLHGAAVQPEGDRRQPEEVGRLRARHPARRADREVPGEDPDAPDAGRRDLRHRGRACCPNS